jgi:hypothetical protein
MVVPGPGDRGEAAFVDELVHASDAPDLLAAALAMPAFSRGGRLVVVDDRMCHCPAVPAACPNENSDATAGDNDLLCAACRHGRCDGHRLAVLVVPAAFPLRCTAVWVELLGELPPPPGFLPPACCPSCHEDEDEGYQPLIRTELPAARLWLETCCEMVVRLEEHQRAARRAELAARARAAGTDPLQRRGGYI